jgi:hypothetical protein
LMDRFAADPKFFCFIKPSVLLQFMSMPDYSWNHCCNLHRLRNVAFCYRLIFSSFSVIK